MAIDNSNNRTDKKGNILRCTRCQSNHYDFEHGVITNKLGKTRLTVILKNNSKFLGYTDGTIPTDITKATIEKRKNDKRFYLPPKGSTEPTILPT